MILPNFSVLLLAWDDADPAVVVLGGSGLPPTQQLVYQLAAQRPVLAVYPHLPAAPLAPAAGAPQPTGRQAKKTAPSVPAASASPLPEPGIVRLPAPTRPGTPTELVRSSRIVGLNDLTPARSAQPQPVLGPPAATPPRPAVAPVRNQWPPAPAQGLPQQQQTPVAPYAGASPALAPLSRAAPPAAAHPAATVPTPLFARPTGQRPNPYPVANDLNPAPDPELPTPRRPLPAEAATAETRPAEATNLAAPDYDAGPEVPAAPKAAAASPEPATRLGPAVAAPALDGLNFRMIQYARRAAQLVRDRTDFGVIYAPNWPAWLAALEIRNSSGQPLVLYAAGLAADFAAPAERGWLLEVERMALRRATLILVPTEALRRRLQAQYGPNIGEVRVVAAPDEQAVQQALGGVATG